MARFVGVREGLRKERIGDGGVDTCHALSDTLDAAIAASAAGLPDGLAVVAVGGYGRREQSLYSDVDVMLLHRGGPMESWVRQVVYPLWDANLKVGHSVRTVAECVTAARESFESLTSLLSARTIAGDASLVVELNAAMASHLKGRPLVGQLTEAERERRDTDPYPLMAADLKAGRGGLRTFQGFYWQRRRAELLGMPVGAATDKEAAAVRALLSVRNALHAAAGRAIDDFVPDLREPAARWLGLDAWDTASLVTHSLRTGDRLAVERWPDLLADSPRTSVAARIKRRFTKSPPPSGQSRPLGIVRQAAGRSTGFVLDEAARATIRNAGSHSWAADDVQDFVALLDSGERGRVAFGVLDSLGWVGANLPEVLPTLAAPQLAPFHEHPVDTHLWRTVDEMRRLIDGRDEWYATIAAELDDRAHLLLAAWLHDIGKGRDGDHSTVGAELTLSLAERIGLPAGEQLAKLVRIHLLLSATATRRDTNDPAVIAEVAAACEDLATLRSLYLLSVADARATGRTMWSDWKSTLLRNLFVRLAGHLDPDAAGQSTRERIAAVAAATGVTPEDVAAHVELSGTEYLAAHSDEEIGAHVKLAASGRRIEAVFIDPDSPAPRLSVIASDLTGLLGAIAGVLAIHNLEILDARLFTRSDGLACDTLHVRRVLPDVAFPDTELLINDLTAALAGDLDLQTEVAAKAATYSTGGSGMVVVRAPTDPTLRFTPIEVRCADRPGALFHIVQAIYAAGLDVRQARIDTRAGEVRDLFYVLRDGEPIRDVNELQPLIADLRRALRHALVTG